MAGACSTHGIVEKCIRSLSRNTVRDYTTSDTGVDWQVILKWILDKHDGKMWTGFIWLSIGTNRGLLCIR
jgi:hypothetical protein